jgi:hypothetical protein
MSLLQFTTIIVAIIFLFFGIDLYKRKKVNILHFLVFLFWSGALTLFALNQKLLNQFWSFFGVARGADLVVYGSLVVLAYFYIILFNHQTKDKHELTRLISQLTINNVFQNEEVNIKNYKNKTEKDNYIFNIRAYNEWQVIWTVIDEIVAAWFKKILFVNDGSRDNTLEVLKAKKLQHKDCLFIILSHTINRGGWAANQTWYKFIQTYAELLNIKRFVWFDADGQMNIKDMDKFMSEIKKDQSNKSWKKIEVYLWSRFTKWGSSENMPPMRKYILAISRFITKIFYWANVSDPHNWYRVIDINSFQKFNITADGMHYANEVNEQIKKHKMKYKDVPVHILYTEYSMHSTAKWHRNKNSDSIKLAMEMIYQKIFFR